MSDRKVPVVSVVGTVALVLTLTLNTVVGLLLIATRQSAADFSKCSAQWQQQFGSAYRARIAAAKKVDTALDGVLRAVAAEDPDAFRRAVAQYVQLRDDQATARADNPLPPLPEQLCGTPEEIRR